MPNDASAELIKTVTSDQPEETQCEIINTIMQASQIYSSKKALEHLAVDPDTQIKRQLSSKQPEYIFTPTALAAARGHFKVVKLLNERKTSPYLPLAHMAFWSYEAKKEEELYKIARFLFSAHPDLNLNQEIPVKEGPKAGCRKSLSAISATGYSSKPNKLQKLIYCKQKLDAFISTFNWLNSSHDEKLIDEAYNADSDYLISRISPLISSGQLAEEKQHSYLRTLIRLIRNKCDDEYKEKGRYSQSFVDLSKQLKTHEVDKDTEKYYLGEIQKSGGKAPQIEPRIFFTTVEKEAFFDKEFEKRLTLTVESETTVLDPQGLRQLPTIDPAQSTDPIQSTTLSAFLNGYNITYFAKAAKATKPNASASAAIATTTQPTSAAAATTPAPSSTAAAATVPTKSSS